MTALHQFQTRFQTAPPRTLAHFSLTWLEGKALVRSVSRLEGANVDRLAWMLAHAVAHGGAKELERVRAGADPILEHAATRALALQDDVRTWTAALREGRGETEVQRAVTPLFRRAGP